MTTVRNANVLILGKTGSGKTALFNYLFGAEIRETGAGRPVSGMGIATEHVMISETFGMHLYDSWGLEAGKSGAWATLVNDVLESHDVEAIDEWFHSIIYCISAKSARIEDFEIEIINALHQEGNRVVVVLTHCDVNHTEEAITAIKAIVVANTPLETKDIFTVSSQGKKLLGGRETSPFGREALICRIEKDLLASIALRIPHCFQEVGEECIEAWYSRCCYRIDKDLLKPFGCGSLKEKERNRLFNRYAQETLDDIEGEYERLSTEGIHYYQAFCDAMGKHLPTAPRQKRTPMIPVALHIDLGGKTAASVVNLPRVVEKLMDRKKEKVHKNPFADFYKAGLRQYRKNFYDRVDALAKKMAHQLEALEKTAVETEQ